MSRLHSFRTRQWREITRHGAKHWRVETDIGVVAWQDQKKLFFLPNAVPSTADELYGLAAAVYMSTGDAHWLLSGSQARRTWLDSLIALHDASYMELLRRWHKILAQRNAWLRSQNFDPSIGSALEPIFISIGWQVTEARQKLFQALNPILAASAASLSRGIESAYAFEYRPNFKESPATLATHLEQERALGHSLQGPHRDDWTIKLNDRPLDKYGSEGQIQIAALATKLAEAAFIRLHRSTPPWLLMDDILAPLDAYRRAAFIEAVPKDMPMIFTSPSPPDPLFRSHFYETLDLDTQVVSDAA